MFFFRQIALIVLLLVQPVFVLAGVVEVDVLDAPGVLDKGKAISQPLQHWNEIVSSPDNRVHSVDAAATKKTFPESHLLGAGDVIEIKVFGQDELSFSTRLDESGVINYQFLGEIPVVGITTSELENIIASGLKDGYLISPDVNVSIVEYRPFYIKGQVENPGPYPYQPGLTLAKAIAIAGGFSEFAAKDEVFVIREKDRQHESSKVVFRDMIHPGDIVTVNESMFYIDGAVKKPGKYPLRSGLTVREAIALAGGLTERGSTSKIHIKTSQRGMVHIGLDDEIKSGSSIVAMESYF